MRIKSDRSLVNKLAHHVDEASAISGVGRSLLYEMIKEGRLRSVKVAGRRLILHEDLVALLKSGEQATALPIAESGLCGTSLAVAQLRELSQSPPAEPLLRGKRCPGSRDIADVNRRMVLKGKAAPSFG
jgi:excisionase family DNA binding protein